MSKIRKKKIAILADFPWTFFSDGATGRGGGQSATWLTQLAQEFSGQDEFEIHWISLDRVGAKSCSREWGGQTFHLIPCVKLSVDLLCGYFFAKRRLLSALAATKPDIIHCWGSERAYALVCSGSSVPTIFSLQGILSHLRKLNLLPSMWQWQAISRWEPYYLRNATIVTCESSWGCNIVKGLYAGVDVRQIEYGVNPSFFKVTWTPRREQPYALFVGTLVAGKGIDVLIEAFARMPNRGWRLRVAGDGPLRAKLEAKNVRGVEWLGLIRWETLERELSEATCLVLPTLADTSPNVVKEARVVGLPVITSPHGGQVDYVLDGKNGFIVDPKDPNKLAEALIRLMENPELAAKMGACHKEENRRYLHPSKTAEGFLAIYRELLARAYNGHNRS